MEQQEIGIGSFRLDLARGRLTHAGVAIELKSKALAILGVLAQARGAVVTKDELMAQVWPGLVVEENNLQVHVSALRKVLAQDTSGAVHLVTVPAKGYRLLGVRDAGTLPPVAAGTNSQANRPSIAVLPFVHLGDDPAQEYFVDGVVEDIITGLSRVKWLSVVASHSSFAYRMRSADVAQIARELDVRYLLQGSLRRADDRIRISAHLIETAGNTQIWAERFDRRLGDLFALQDEIAVSVVGAIEPGLRRAEVERIRRKRPDALDAYDLVLRALPYVYKLMPDASAPAIPLLTKALELDPDYAVAHATLAWCYHVRFSRGGLHAADRDAAIHHARAAVALASDDALALAIAAFVIWFDAHDTSAAFDLFDRALAISPSNVMALNMSAVALAWSGHCEQAIARAERALRLSPFDAMVYLSHQALAGAHFTLGRYELARASARRAVEANPNFSVPFAYLCAALARLGQLDEARAAARRLLELDPGFSIAGFRVTVGVSDAVFAGFADAWRLAGLPA